MTRFECILETEPCRQAQVNGERSSLTFLKPSPACPEAQADLRSAAIVIPFLVLLLSFALLRVAGLLGVSALNNVDWPLRIAFCLMFFLTASAHWGKGRADLIQMVPPNFPKPAMLVSTTGVFEILGAVGLLVPSTARWAAVCLAILLVALFPANVRAARHHLTILGRPTPGLLVRGLMQIIFIAALVVIAAHHPGGQ